MRTIGLTIGIAVLVGGCEDSSELGVVTQSRQVMGTLAEITAVASDRATALAAVEAAYARLGEIERLLSCHIADSEVGRLNALDAGERLIVSPETFDVLARATAIAEASGGAFDVTCRPLVTLWKQAGVENKLPGDSAIREALARVGWRHVQLDKAARTVAIGVDGMQVDLGGIAKGYALDLAAVAMKQAGASAGIVNIGGDVLAIGQPAEGTPWRIGIEDPFQSGLAGVIELIDRAVATSGIQHRFTVIGPKRYSHIIDPRSGRPVEQALSVTVIAGNGADADAWATAFSVLTVREGLALAATLPETEVMWTWGSLENPQTAETPGFDRFRSLQ